MTFAVSSKSIYSPLSSEERIIDQRTALIIVVMIPRTKPEVAWHLPSSSPLLLLI